MKSKAYLKVLRSIFTSFAGVTGGWITFNRCHPRLGRSHREQALAQNALLALHPLQRNRRHVVVDNTDASANFTRRLTSVVCSRRSFMKLWTLSSRISLYRLLLSNNGHVLRNTELQAEKHVVSLSRRLYVNRELVGNGLDERNTDSRPESLRTALAATVG